MRTRLLLKILLIAFLVSVSATWQVAAQVGEANDPPAGTSAQESALAAATPSDPENPDLVGNRIDRTAHERVSLGLSYDNPRLFHALVQGRYTGDRYYDDEN